MFELLHISSLANISTLICDSVVMLVIYKITIIFNLLIILYDPFLVANLFQTIIYAKTY